MTTLRHHSIAILGAGPVGLEAALAAVDAGLDFALYESGDRVADHVRDWAHVRLFTPWRLNASPRARRHLEAYGHELPDDQERPTGGELVEHLLDPLASLPTVAPSLRTGVRVVRVGRDGLLKSDEIGTGGRAGRPFRILLRDHQGREWVEEADAVLDCTGTWGQPNTLGRGGIPAPGEEASERFIHREIPGPTEVTSWSTEHVLLVGGGHSAQTAARTLAGLASAHPGTRVTWALRSPSPRFALEDDSLPARAELHGEAQRLAATAPEAAPPGFEARPGTTVESLHPREDGVTVTLRSEEEGADTKRTELEVDRVVSLTGSVGDAALYRQLQVHECYATSGPMNLSAALLGSDAGADCMAQPSPGVDSLRNPEPQFFILGSKSYGRNNTFLLRTGWDQVDQILPVVVRELRASDPDRTGDEAEREVAE